MHQIALRYTTNFIFSFFFNVQRRLLYEQKRIIFQKTLLYSDRIFIFRENVNKQRLFIAILKKNREFKFQTT